VASDDDPHDGPEPLVPPSRRARRLSAPSWRRRSRGVREKRRRESVRAKGELMARARAAAPISSAASCLPLKMLVSHCTFDRGSLSEAYRKPFDLLVEGNESG